MLPSRTRNEWWIWLMALGYFAFYIPYSALTKALSLGLLPGMSGPVSGFLLLPATAVATTAVLLILVAAGGGWRYLERRRILGLSVPIVRARMLISGAATAVIIGTTTLNYTFVGISIVFALLLMRGGVLILAPVVDTLLGRISRKVVQEVPHVVQQRSDDTGRACAGLTREPCGLERMLSL